MSEPQRRPETPVTIEDDPDPDRRGWLELPLVTALAALALLPVARGLARGQSFFFRDLAGHFFPQRLFALQGLLQGRATYWNPYTHEGEPLSLPPVAYPIDLLQLLLPSEAGLTLVLAFHLPLAALAFYALARHLELARVPAAGGAAVYALGGFALSTVNLYVYLQALAWAPLVVRGLMKAAKGGRRDLAWAAVFVFLALTTLGAEIVAQTLVMGLCLAAPRDWRTALRLAGVAILGAGLAGFALLPMGALVAESARGAGFPTEVVLAHSVHPITLLQTMAAGLYGDPARLTDSFWGQNYFPMGYPYFLSLYLGAGTFALVIVGVASRRRPEGTTLAVVGAIALLVCLGRFAGLAPLVDAVSAIHGFRFPSKAFFTVHFSAALLVALTLDALSSRNENRAWRRLALVGMVLFVSLAIIPSAVLGHPGLARFLVAGFFPPHLAWGERLAAAAFVVHDAAIGGAVALALAAVAWLTARERLTPHTAVALAASLIAADVLRAGAGLNPMVSPSFFSLSKDAKRMAGAIQASGGRVYAVDPAYTSLYRAARAARGRDHEAWSFALLRESFVPEFNLGPRVRTALSIDRTMLTPEKRVLQPTDASPATLPLLVPRLQAAAVGYVASIEPLRHPDLDLVDQNRSPEISPLAVHLYRLSGRRPRIEILGGGQIVSTEEGPDLMWVVVETASPSTLVVRDPHAPGWRVRVDGKAAPLLRHEEGYRAVTIPKGRGTVEFTFTPPGLQAGLALSGVSLVVLGWLLGSRTRQPFGPAR